MSTKKRTAVPARKTVAAPKRTYAKRTYTARAPAATRYRGTGDYVKAPRAIRPSKSTTKSLGGTIGAHLGHGLQTVIKALTGFGDYEVESNSLMPGTLGGDPPIIQNSRNNSHVVHHREYIGDVYASTAFSIQTYPLNPGLLSSFPWVSQQADSYEQYKFRGAVFEFKSMSSDAVLSSAASSSLGTVIMSTQYNALEAPFSDKRTMENYEYANSAKPSCSMLHPIECKMSQTTVSELYVRTGVVSQGDLRLFDLGNFSIAVQGKQNVGANQVIGELGV
ncbi:capsid protein [Sewage-associated circular DNA virus-13]|uniref:capsid protein n=1 Tax=Sewage-associated circular DNA virus-13 TaxID=1519389 RepID=UPI0004D1CD4C|nr:capsid protein [Sewage-associated circular DNA virus-13]AIF34804.1 capsid protein [Sewage-associated circular DNA virus-13]